MIDLQRVLVNLGLVSSLGRPSPLWTSSVNSTHVHASIFSEDGSGGLAPGVLLGVPETSPYVDFDDPNTDVSSIEDLLSLLDTLDPIYHISDTDTDSCSFTPYPSPAVPIEPFEAWDPAKATFYRYRQQQSVNLGAWFVQEEWMNPLLFACAAGARQAEVDVASGWGGTDGARQVLEKHWDEWIGAGDFEYLKGLGINTVRLPIG